MLTDKEATGDYHIPRIIYSDAYLFRDRRLRRSGAAGHDLSRTLGLHLAARPADRPSRRSGRCDPPAGGAARSRRAAVPGRADRSRRPARPAGLRRRGGQAALSRLCGLHRRPRTHAGHRTARRLARRGRRADRQRRAQPDQLERYIANGCFWQHELPPEQLYYKQANAPISNARSPWDYRAAHPDRAAALCRAAADVPPRRRAATDRSCRRPHMRARIAHYFDPLPIWYTPFEEAAVDSARLPAARDHAAADARCIIPGARRMPGCARSSARTVCTCTATPRRAGPRRRRLGLGREPHTAGSSARCG